MSNNGAGIDGVLGLVQTCQTFREEQNEISIKTPFPETKLEWYSTLNYSKQVLNKWNSLVNSIFIELHNLL